MPDTFTDLNEERGSVIAYVLIAIAAGYLCGFVGLAFFPFWYGISFAVLGPTILMLIFAFRLAGRPAPESFPSSKAGSRRDPGPNSLNVADR